MSHPFVLWSTLPLFAAFRAMSSEEGASLHSDLGMTRCIEPSRDLLYTSVAGRRNSPGERRFAAWEASNTRRSGEGTCS